MQLHRFKSLLGRTYSSDWLKALFVVSSCLKFQFSASFEFDSCIRGTLFRSVPSVIVWHQQKNISFLEDLVKLKLKTWICVSLWRKIISVKLPPFWSGSEKCSKIGHVTLSRWILKRPFYNSFGQSNLFKCLKNAFFVVENISQFQDGFCYSSVILLRSTWKWIEYISHYYRLFTPSKS